MSEGLNRWVGVGNLAAEPNLTFTQGGQALLRFRVACSRRFKANDGEWNEKTAFVSCQLWGKRAEALAKILEKGSQVWVEGEIETRSWEDKDGQKRYATEINASNIGLLGSKRRDEPQKRRGAEHPQDNNNYAYDDDEQAPF